MHAPTTRVPPYVLISGPESVLAERALDSTLEALRAGDPDLEVIKLYAEGYQGGTHHARVPLVVRRDQGPRRP